MNCNHCEYIAKSHDILINHEASVHKIKHFKCDKCDFTTCYKHSLKKHQSVHIDKENVTNVITLHCTLMFLRNIRKHT